jgi:N-acetylmuramoyl-L-alanine amidase
MLFAVLRRVLRFAIFLSIACLSVGVGHAIPDWQSNQAPTAATLSVSRARSDGSQIQAPPVQRTAPQQSPIPPAATPAPPVHVGPVIVIDPAHGGTDNGAQGPSGTLEKDVVLRFARQVRAEFERQGFRVVMTRNDDSNPSYEDRAAVANAYRDAIFISVHVSSTGKVGTAHAYSYQFSNAGWVASGAGSGPSDEPKSLVIWEEAQRPYLETSHRLADVLQTELAQRFAGSASISTPFAIRELRSVSIPAIAVELSSVSASDGTVLAAMGAPLASAVVRSVQIFRPGATLSRNTAGAKPQAAGAN